MDIELVTDPDACVVYIVSPLAGLGGGILWRPPAYSLLAVGLLVNTIANISAQHALAEKSRTIGNSQ